MQETQEMQVRSLGQEDPLEEGMATHSSILAWIIPWTEAPGRLQSMGLQSQTQLSPHACRLVKGHFGMYTGKAWKRGLTFMALLPIAKTWKQPKYPLTDEWVSEMWALPYLHAGLPVEATGSCWVTTPQQ